MTRIPKKKLWLSPFEDLEIIVKAYNAMWC